ncbi:hypothetical protein Moror_5014 [Moniliophthora roreri MCA 2997]|uniref:Uncharacterized protein n=1 Tax=Moniliophthora roreri (strain MCA 2997) TaxID=1381753 RepID=V2WXQ2_MONRO|nr:hypothetical protein Moror_5014 [Moniliophthora roreri MCA 2997]
MTTQAVLSFQIPDQIAAKPPPTSPTLITTVESCQRHTSIEDQSWALTPVRIRAHSPVSKTTHLVYNYCLNCPTMKFTAIFATIFAFTVVAAALEAGPAPALEERNLKAVSVASPLLFFCLTRYVRGHVLLPGAFATEFKANSAATSPSIRTVPTDTSSSATGALERLVTSTIDVFLPFRFADK